MININQKINLAGFTFIIPSICVGNVAQLAVDLIIETLAMEKIGIIWHPAIIPIIGPPAYWRDKDKSTTAAELYVSEEKSLVILQLRSPLVAGLMGDFFNNLSEFIRTNQLKETIILSSSFAHEKHTIAANPFEYVPNELFQKIHESELNNLKWSTHSGQVIHGGGFAMQLMKTFDEKVIPAVILFKYVSEGDNSPDACHLTSFMNELLSIMPLKPDGTMKVKTPLSWKLLFGNAAPKDVY